MRKSIKRSSATILSALVAAGLLAGPAFAAGPTDATKLGDEQPQSEERGPEEAEDPDERTERSFAAVETRTGVAPDAGMKESCPNPQFMVYYRTWRDVMMPSNANSDLPDPNVIAMTDLPFGVDIVSLFHYVDPSKNIDQEPFWTTVRDVYVPELHERGTKVIRTFGVSELFSKEYGLTADSTDEEFDAVAQVIVKKYVTDDGIDGIDIDMEQNLSSDQQVILGGMYKALSRYLGPLSETDTLLVYDTNRYAETSYIEQVAPYIDYLFYQSYGAKAPRLDRAIEGYSEYISSCQFLPGYTSPEEGDNNYWPDTVGPFWESNAAAMALWNPPNGEKGGIFQYAIDRDGMTYDEPDWSSIRPTTFEYAKRVIAIIKHAEFDQTKLTSAEKVNELPYLSEDSRELALSRIEDAETFEQVFDALGEAAAESDLAAAAALEEAKTEALKELESMAGLSQADRDAAVAAIEAATSVDEVQAALDAAHEAEQVRVRRLFGVDRFGTNVAVNGEFAGVRGGTVVVATGTDFADALSAAPAAVVSDAPLFLAGRDSMSVAALAQIKDLEPKRVYVVGGSGAVSTKVVSQLRDAAGVMPIRVGGVNRYETSAKVFQVFFSGRDVDTVFVATGVAFPDALSASAAAGALEGPVLLVQGASGKNVLPASSTLMKRLGVENVVVTGGVGAVNERIEASLVASFPVVERVGGANRYETNLAVDDYLTTRSGGVPVSGVWVATGANFPDALSASVPAGSLSERLVLSNGKCLPSPVVSEWIQGEGSQVELVTLVGGTGVLSEGLEGLPQCQ